MIVNYREYIGQEYMTNEGYIIQIADYVDRHHVMIKFKSSNDTQIWTTMQNIIKGQIKNPYHRSVYGVGYYGEGQYSARNDTVKTDQYIEWMSMFNRCYSDKYHEKEPAYIGCIVSEEFHNFQNFARWYDEKIYICNHQLELDKDLLFEGNKIYAPSKCCFIPKEVNNAIRYHRHDKKYMDGLYKKYKKELPYYLKLELYKLSKREVA